MHLMHLQRVRKIKPDSSDINYLLERPQVRAVIRLKHDSTRTEEAYWHWIKTFILFNQKRHPNEMGEIEISRFLSHLATNKKVSASTQNQALSALLFLYRDVLKKPLDRIDNIVRAKRPSRLPVVFTRDDSL